MEHISKKLINWASVLDEGTLEQARRTAAHAVYLPAPGPDARCPSRQGRDGRVGHPDARRDHPGGGGRRHRLRHDRRPHPVHRAGHQGARRPGGPARRPSRARSRCRPASTTSLYTAQRQQAGSRSSSSASAPTARRRSRRTGGCSSARLGSGNHFIEVSLDEAERVWLFLHSGSRGVGNKIAQRHIKIAQRAGRAVLDPAARP